MLEWAVERPSGAASGTHTASRGTSVDRGGARCRSPAPARRFHALPLESTNKCEKDQRSSTFLRTDRASSVRSAVWVRRVSGRQPTWCGVKEKCRGGPDRTQVSFVRRFEHSRRSPQRQLCRCPCTLLSSTFAVHRTVQHVARLHSRHEFCLAKEGRNADFESSGACAVAAGHGMYRSEK